MSLQFGALLTLSSSLLANQPCTVSNRALLIFNLEPNIRRCAIKGLAAIAVGITHLVFPSPIGCTPSLTS